MSENTYTVTSEHGNEIKLHRPDSYTIVSLEAVENLMKNAQGIKGGTVILAFDRYEEATELVLAMNAGKMAAALNDIHNHVWRPSWKHGYPVKELQDLLDDEAFGEKAYRVIELLHEIYLEQVKELPEECT
jgi:hypothetical protein